MSSIIAICFTVAACWTTDLFLSSQPRPKLTGHHISPFSTDGTNLYFGAGHCLYRLVTAKKELEPIICTEGWTFQRPVIDGYRAYAHTIASPEPGMSFVAMNWLTSEIIWRSQVETGEAPFRSIKDNIFVVNGKIYTAKRDKVYALDTESGKTIWQTNSNWMNFTNPFLIHNGLLWYPTDQDNDNGRLIAVNLTTGEVEQSIDLRPKAYFDQLLYIDDEWIIGLDSRLEVVTNTHNHVFAVALTNPDQLVWYSEDLSGLFGVNQILRYDNSFMVSENSNFIYSLDVNNGQVKWSFSPTDKAPSISESNSTQIAIFKLGDTIYGIETEFGYLIWVYQLQQQDTNEPSTGSPLPLVTEDVVYVANVDTIDVLETQTGKLLWQVKVNSEYEYIRDIP